MCLCLYSIKTGALYHHPFGQRCENKKKNKKKEKAVRQKAHLVDVCSNGGQCGLCKAVYDVGE